MISLESGCVDCGFPCRKSACRYFEEVHFYCDVCKMETDSLYVDDGQEICYDCLKDKFNEINYDNYESYVKR